MDNKISFNVINTNARSLRPKLSSFIQCFVGLSLTLAVVTETWFAEGGRLERETEDLLLGHGLRLQALNRDPLLSGVSYGGVALITRAISCKSTIMAFPNPEKFEVLTTCIKIPELSRLVFATAVYIPPGYTVPRGRQCLLHVCNTVLYIKNKHTDPLILVAGDFNQWDIASALAEFSDMTEVTTPATRADRHIDKIFTNWSDDISESGCHPPLVTDLVDGVRTASDHNIQYMISRLPRREPVRWETVTTRPITDNGKAGFLADLEAQDWAPVLSKRGPNAKVEHFHFILDDLVGKHFPLKTTKRKEDDLPWFDDRARKMVKRKSAIYRAEGPSERWESERSKLETYLDKQRLSFLEKQRKKFIGPDAAAAFYKNVRSFSSAEKPKSFDVRDLCPGMTDAQAANAVAEFFNTISREFAPLAPNQIPATYHRQLDLLTEGQVEKMLRDAKKPRSTVAGDIPPVLVNQAAPFLKKPVTDIYNCIITTLVWPVAWKREFVTVIPKKTIPESFADLRNISCTPLLSKIFERHLLARAQEEFSLKENQYGGVKGCSTTHMIVAILQEICENAEDYRCATVLTSIDYAKAFNRVSYQHCLEAFRKKGSSTPIIRLLSSFLTNRTMSVRVGQQWSDPLDVDGGCPQGSVIGVLLFNTATDCLEDDFVLYERNRLRLPTVLPPLSPQQPINVGPFVASSSTPAPCAPPPADPPYSPIESGPLGATDPDIQFKPRINLMHNQQPILCSPPPSVAVGTQTLVEKMVLIFKYIDDNIICEKLNFGNVPVTPGDPPTKLQQAFSSQNAFRIVTGNAEDIGMQVNTKKTKLLCISDALNYTPKVFIEDKDGSVIQCCSSMKILGFHFSNKPTVQLHIDETVKKIRMRYWSLRHLAKLGFTETELVQVYKSVVLPIADYCAPAYHSMMTDLQDQQMEAAQIGALRAIFGYGKSARQLRIAAGVTTLRERRIEQTDKFATKAANSQRFAKWFPKTTGRRSARNREIYEERMAKTERLKNSPLYYMRRRLNGKEGKIYGERNRRYRENFDLNEE